MKIKVKRRSKSKEAVEETVEQPTEVPIDEHYLARIEKALGVRFQTQDSRTIGRAIGAYALEHARSIVQRMGTDVYGGVIPADPFAVLPNPLGLL